MTGFIQIACIGAIIYNIYYAIKNTKHVLEKIPEGAENELSVIVAKSIFNLRIHVYLLWAALFMTLLTLDKLT